MEPANAVDHRIPISKRGRQERVAAEGCPALEKLTSLCERCHNAKTAAEQRGEDYMRKGCDVFGRPLDQNHALYLSE